MASMLLPRSGREIRSIAYRQLRVNNNICCIHNYTDCKSENDFGARNLYGHGCIGRTASYGPAYYKKNLHLHTWWVWMHIEWYYYRLKVQKLLPTSIGCVTMAFHICCKEFSPLPHCPLLENFLHLYRKLVPKIARVWTLRMCNVG